MKNKIFFILLVSFTINAQNLKVPADQLRGLQETFDWKKEPYLVVNYRFLPNYCSYDNYGELKKTYKWYHETIYSKIDSLLFRNIFVYADKLLAKKIIDDKDHYDDIGLYFKKNFFPQKDNCYGLLIINKKGEYRTILGEYSKKDVENIFEELK